MSRDEATLLDIVNAARLIGDFIAGLDQDQFQSDLKTQSAVLHQLLVMGEATKRLSDDFRAVHPSVPWRLIAGMRDKLVHEYDEVDIPEVWSTASRDVPRLLATLGLERPDQ